MTSRLNATVYDPVGQKRRRIEIYSAVTNYLKDGFDDTGRWIDSEQTMGLRERLWSALVFLEMEQPELVAKARAVVETSIFRVCEFSPMAALQLLVRFNGRLAGSPARTLKDYLVSMADHFLAPRMDFVGVNDNFPAMAAYTLVVGGEWLSRPDLVECGVARLGHLDQLLTRRGVTSEYNSPTYTPIQLLALAEIGNWAQHETARHLAMACEARIWRDLLGHYHPPTSGFAGPFSRAYTVDSVGHVHQAHMVLYALVGERMAIHPGNTILAASTSLAGQVIHNGVRFMQVSAAWMATPDYHCPADLIEAMMTKTYPYGFMATTEYGPSTDGPPNGPPAPGIDEFDEYAAGHGAISTYMTEDYALGVAEHEFHSGAQTDSFHVRYRRKAEVRSQADVGTVYARYMVNEKRLGAAEQSGVLDDEGRKLGVQQENTAMLLYKPRGFLRKGVHSLKLSLVLPAQFGPVEEIWLGDRRLNSMAGASTTPCPVYVKDGPVYLAMHPLLLTDHGRDVAVRVEPIDHYVMVSFYNYAGPARDFARGEFLCTGNGVVAEVRSAQEVDGFAAFRQQMAAVVIEDAWFTCDHYRGVSLRRTRYARPGVVIEAEWSPITEGVKRITVNGMVPDHPRLQVQSGPSAWSS